MLKSRFFKLNFLWCTTSLFGLGLFLGSIEHDFIKIWNQQSMTDWHSWISISLLHQWWSVVGLILTLLFTETSMPILYKNVRNVRFAKSSIRSIDLTVEVFRKILNCSLQPKLHLAEQKLLTVFKNCLL